ncbi:protein YIPF5 [Tribolium castaneum]|uniref:protein YIPF5 n=1 Tax=Tribolium castaneum TaxID=7070 RepID=UPI00046C3D19|nr:PREDICTED: protein YIPF5 [Tribolium castaneum]|eukprot:XP_008200964.1 PREDICTED: protein YIPF5 [Tribolium castaneum]
MTEEMYFWSPQDQNYAPNYYETDYNQIPAPGPDFQPFDDFGGQIPDVSKFYDPRNVDFEEEPPLLEELEIYPDRIVQKMLAVLNPFRSHGLTDDADYLNKDPDLAGPIFFYLILAVCLFLSGNKAHFGYIYGISVLSCLMMYSLLSLMTAQSVFNVTTVASVLGYSLIPIVGLSVFGVFFSLKGLLGGVLATLSVMWSSISASRLFVAISGDREQQPLFAYPCALVSAVYVLLVIF